LKNIKPVTSDKQLFEFSKQYLGDHVERFRKDISICLRSNDKRSHAYLPALMTCIAFADLLSGLYAGNLKTHGLTDLQTYAARFMDAANYDSDRLKLLYEGFRHKVAHLGLPYAVFDTSTKPNTFGAVSRRRLAWTVNASAQSPAIHVTKYPKPRFLQRTLTPWPVSYDHRIRVSVRKLAADVVKSIYGRSGYLYHLESDTVARQNFRSCLKDLYPH